MRKNIAVILLMTMISGLFSSCEKMFGDFLDKQPSNELTEEQVFNNWENVEAYHFDTYNFLRNGLAPINDSWLDAATDLATTSHSTGGTKTSFNIGNYYAGSGASELRDTWEHYYRAIRKCNTLIARIDAVPLAPGESAADRAVKASRLKAEARFFRAYFYWELALRYGPVPIITQSLNPTDPTVNKFERPTEKECFQFILTELEGCKADLYSDSELHGSLPDWLGRITQGVNAALQSRIKLYLASPRYSHLGLSSWQDAADAAQSFMNTYPQYGLFVSILAPTLPYASVFTTDAVSGNNKEIIFWRNNPAGDWWPNEAPVGYGGKGGLSPSQNLVDMYDMANGASPFSNYDATGSPVYTGTNVTINPASGYNDQNPYQNRDPRFYQTIHYNGAFWWQRPIETFEGGKDKPVGNANATPTGYYNRKYLNEAAKPPVLGGGLTNRDWILIRYAEILLNYAEALNEAQGPGPEVFNALQQIRNRVGLTAPVAAKPEFNTPNELENKEALRKFIRRERTVELAFENHRMWDLKRWSVAREALSRPIFGMTITKSGNNFIYARKVVESRVFEDRMYLYPIPEEEIWKTGMKNNTGW